MSFQQFHGNSETVHRLRDMIARDHFPHGIVLAGGKGSGKYTLALMLARALNCLTPPQTDGLPDFCGTCANCVGIALSADLDARFAEAVEARENLRETDKKETRLFVQTHPDVLIIPPDPPQMMIKVDQVRRVIETIYYRPAEGKEKVYIFTDSAFMKEAANSLLKVLEEPPDFATIFLLTENAGELLPIRKEDGPELQLLNITRCVSALDREKSEWGASVIPKTYAFHKEHIPLSLFKIPETGVGEILCAEWEGNPEKEFKAAVEKHCLKGMRFQLLWEG
jgi:DNA polymerase-3 subunit delta'